MTDTPETPDTTIPAATRDRWVTTFRVARIYEAILVHTADPWFLDKVNEHLREGFYFDLDVETTGYWRTDSLNWAWITPNHPNAVEWAWICAAIAYLNGHRRAQRGY